MKRREFIKCSGAGAVLALGPKWTSSAASEGTKPGFVKEPERDIPVVDEADVIVCGAGPAGVAAAIASSRKGAKTILLETHGCLGGILTAGLLSWILDHQNKSGLMKELLQRLTEREGRTFTKKGTGTNGYDAEVMKLVLEDLCSNAGTQIHLHTRVCAALRDTNNRLCHVITESKSGREAFKGKMFIDCTGDGDLAAFAGCRFDMGHPETGRTQPMTLMALVTGISPDEIRPFYHDQDDGPWAQPKDRLREEMERGGHSPSYGKPTLFRIRDDLFAMMTNHEYEVKGTNTRDVTRATLRARKEINQIVTGLRSLGSIWKNIRLVATAEQIGVREGRRIHGIYTVTQNDIKDGKEQKDAVCKVKFGIDVHSTDPKKVKGIEQAPFRSKPYDIPLRALIARDVQGLMMAGRCISGDFLAHSSYRVTGNAVIMGEAAGKVAAIAVKTNRLPQAVDISEIT
ncbi:MAG: FAD-dependent oxidoreductase [Kiritimatiellae bacterium]|nr:FAD-dependent oxidoreductase [Kiritimatiellia bacterium]MDD5521546.1 FAD-dependent oxidoreductase [Kiritimatiellia bacterium]